MRLVVWGRTDGCRVKDVEDREKAQENTEDKVLIWGGPGRLDTVFSLTPSLRPSLFSFPLLKRPV